MYFNRLTLPDKHATGIILACNFLCACQFQKKACDLHQYDCRSWNQRQTTAVFCNTFCSECPSRLDYIPRWLSLEPQSTIGRQHVPYNIESTTVLPMQTTWDMNLRCLQCHRPTYIETCLQHFSYCTGVSHQINTSSTLFEHKGCSRRADCHIQIQEKIMGQDHSRFPCYVKARNTFQIHVAHAFSWRETHGGRHRRVEERKETQKIRSHFF